MEDGSITRLEFARLPPYPGATEASIACLLLDETKSAMLGPSAEFEWGVAPTPSRPNLYDIRPSPVAGYGMFATRDIQCGNFTWGDIGPDADSASFVPTMSDLIITALDLLLATRLCESESADLYRLFSHDGSRLNITRQNMMLWKPPLPGFYQGWHRIICREASRIDHAFARGDELFSSYECYDNHAPRAERQAQLARSYGFDCACPVCSLPAELSAQSDATRQMLLEELDRMLEISVDDAGKLCDVEFDAWLADHALPDDHIVRHSERMLALIDAEGAGVFNHNAFHYLKIIRACVALADEEGSRYWAERLMQIHHPLFFHLREHAAGILAKDEEELEQWGSTPDSTRENAIPQTCARWWGGLAFSLIGEGKTRQLRNRRPSYPNHHHLFFESILLRIVMRSPCQADLLAPNNATCLAIADLGFHLHTTV
ncbi:hypothetical protein C8R46DRAFT_1344128 [Mycena filopes]|nr:hypothetical protein C8R46DRAFT_1344128 [Mycena filopes]